MIYIAWFLGSILVGFLGRRRTFGFWGFFLLSVLLTPIVVFIILAVTKPKLAST